MVMTNENWKPIIGYEDLYLVSNLGKIKNIKTGKILKGSNTNTSLIASKLSKKVGQYKNGELINIWKSTRECQRNGYSSSCISQCCNGNQSHHMGFEWRYIID